MALAPLTQADHELRAHITMWGEPGYPINKIGSRWYWRDAFGVKGSPLPYKTKKAAIEAFEGWLSLYRIRYAAERQAELDNAARDVK